MSRMKPWVMSESDAFDLLNAIDERLAARSLDQHHHDVLVRLREMLEEDIASCETTSRAWQDGAASGAEPLVI